MLFRSAMNLIPARLTALLIVAAALVSGGHPIRAIRTWWRDAGRTPSPNAGHPMSAAAGALGVMLEKKDHYRLGDGFALPDVMTVWRSGRMSSKVLRIWGSKPMSSIRSASSKTK